MAHLLSELSSRMHAIRSAEGDTFDLPMPQEELSDALGLSTVHVNRCLQALKRARLIAWSGSKVTGLDREGLAEEATSTATTFTIPFRRPGEGMESGGRSPGLLF
jgi:hypothetical protein